MNRSIRALARAATVSGVVLLCACDDPRTRRPIVGAGNDVVAPAISLVERWPQARREGASPAVARPPAAEIRFDGGGVANVRWRALSGVEGLRVEDGRLVGTTTSAAPMILLETAAPLGADDELWSVSLRLQASAGARAGVHPVREPGPPLEAIVARAGDWPLATPILPGAEPATYTVDLDRVFTLELPVAATAVERILLRPSDVAGADFAVESVRLTFRKERLAALETGPGWHGLGEVYRETLVSRAPEVLAFELTLPERPWLELAVGTIDDVPPVFRVTVTPAGAGPETAGEISVEAPERWAPVRIELGRYGGETVELRLEAVADRPGTLAFWGTPTVRGAVAPDDLEERPQAVIVFLADTLRADHLEAWGYARETMPNLSRLAAEGVRFADTVAQGTWTKVSVSSILTSLYPSTTGVADLNDRIAAGEVTLAEAFRAAGYATFATSSVPFSGQLTNLHQGVEVMLEFGAVAVDRQFRSKSAAGWVDAFLDWLELHRDVPVFAVLHAMDPHSPFRPHAPFDAVWAEDDAGERWAALSARVEPHIEHPLLRRFMAPGRDELIAAEVDPDAFVDLEKDWYDGSIRGMDAELGRLLAGLERLGLEQRALIAFVADHGEEFLDHGRHWHGLTVYGEVANVPMALWGAGVPSGVVVEETVQTIDLMPTLLDLAGLEPPPRAQGTSLVPLMRGGEEGRARPGFVERRSRGGDFPGAYTSFAIVEDGYKLIWNPVAPNGVPEHELYDHRRDPLNLHDIAAEHPEVVERLAAAVRRWRAWAEEQQLDQTAAEAEMSAEELERLRSLGYID